MLTSAITMLLGSFCSKEKIPKAWCESVTVQVYDEDDQSSCGNNRAISLISIA